jgi:tRNA-splicing endonuclease subunit Sen34
MGLDGGGPEAPIRISRIGGRYLVFDVRDIARLRRQSNICAPLVGTSVQSPSQNTFLGVPVELREEDVALMSGQGAAVVQDDTAAHLAILSAQAGSATKDDYKAWLRARRRTLNAVFVKDREQRNSEMQKIAMSKSGQGAPPAAAVPSTPQAAATALSCAVNPAANSNGSGSKGHFTVFPGSLNGRGALHSHLQSKGYYMMPGIRFGCQYSVYPGDPFRYHAHFLANEYGWDENIPLMDLVGAGRLATAVKKGFLLGSEDRDIAGKKGSVRTFCMEWAGM